MDDRSDEELVTMVGRGDIRAFEQIMLRHQRSAVNAAFRFLNDAVEAEDVAQDAFLRVFRAAPSYEPKAKFRTYLYRIVTRLCIDRATKKRPETASEFRDLTDRQGQPIELLTKVDVQTQVRQAINSLAPNQRMAIILRYYESMSYTEIASALETTSKAVERLLARARETLEKKLPPT